MVNVFLAARFHYGHAKWFAGVRAPTATAETVGASRPTGLRLRAAGYPLCSRMTEWAQVFGWAMPREYSTSSDCAHTV